MAYESYRGFLEALERANELIRIRRPVATELEITEWSDREMKKPGGGRALWFEKPTVNGRESSFPLVINAFGSERRMALSLGVNSVDDLAAELASLLKAKPPTTWRQALKLLGTAAELRHTKPRKVSLGACQEVVHQAPFSQSTAVPPTLLDMPVLKCWPLDAGRFMTLPCVVTRDPDSGERNLGLYRMQVYDAQTTGMHWQLHKVGARHGRGYVSKRQRMPVSVFLGGDPAYTFCATAPLPDGVDELMLAGFLRKRAVEMVRCTTNDLEVPADADIVLEGYVDPLEPLRLEGPFGDHTGYYSLEDQYPVFHLTAMTHRRNAIYPATIVGQPPMEDFYLGGASVRLFLPVFKMNFPELVDLALPAEGVFHNLVFASIRKTYPMQAYKIMHGLWGMGQMMFAKYIVVVDEDVNVHNTSEVLFRIGANTDPQRDTLLTRGPADALDHATSVFAMGSKMGIDATRKLPGEAFDRPWPPLIRMDDDTRARIDQYLKDDLGA
jgi:4-hydroxy-3-polyprenylbenzoate decarboxylase